MPEVTDLMRVAQYVKSDRDAPSEVYNAACRLLDELAKPSEGQEQSGDWLEEIAKAGPAIWEAKHGGTA